MKNSRVFGFIVIAITYILAITVGIFVFMSVSHLDVWLKILLADVAATVVVFIISLIFNNASLYDPYWSVIPMIVVPLILIEAGGLTVGGIILIAMVELWGLRLTANWAYTFKGLSVQDWRYDNFKRSSGKAFPLVSLTGIQMMPTLIVFACMMPAIEYAGGGGDFSPLCGIGVTVMLIGIALETLSDLEKHISRAKGSSGIIRSGIWKKGRHPNYLGEILFWWGVYLYAVCAHPELWWTFFGALINTMLFVFISIPMAEKQSALRHADEWNEYKSETRMFI